MELPTFLGKDLPKEPKEVMVEVKEVKEPKAEEPKPEPKTKK